MEKKYKFNKTVRQAHDAAREQRCLRRASCPEVGESMTNRYIGCVDMDHLVQQVFGMMRGKNWSGLFKHSSDSKTKCGQH